MHFEVQDRNRRPVEGGYNHVDLDLAVRDAPEDYEVIVCFELPIALRAIVSRFGKQEDAVTLVSEDREKELVRGRDIAVTCSPEGTVVAVETILIQFRDAGDPYTDRGVVWVYPGTPAMGMVVLRPGAFSADGISPTEILLDAEKAAHTNIVRHFVA